MVQASRYVDLNQGQEQWTVHMKTQIRPIRKTRASSYTSSYAISPSVRAPNLFTLFSEYRNRTKIAWSVSEYDKMHLRHSSPQIQQEPVDAKNFTQYDRGYNEMKQTLYFSNIISINFSRQALELNDGSCK